MIRVGEFKKIKWNRVWARRILFFLGGGFQKVFLRHSPLNKAKHKMYVPEGNLYAFCIAEKEFRQLVRNYTTELMEANMASYAEKFEAKFVPFLRFAEKLSKKAFAKMSNQQLAAIIEDLDERIVDFYELQFCAFLVLEGLGREVEEKLSRQPTGREILQAIATPYQLTKINKAQNELLLLAKRKNISKEKIEQYSKKYGWITVYDYPDHLWSAQEITHHLKGIKHPAQELINSKKHRTKNLLLYKKYLAQVKDPVWRQKVEIVHYFSYLKEMRDDYRRKAYAVIRPLWKEVAKRLRSNIVDVNYLIAPELVEILRGKRIFSSSEIKRRKHFGALASLNGHIQVFTGKRAEQLTNAALGTGHKTIQGTVACEGLVSGKCKIIYHRGEFSKFKKGDILVTTMTHPEFLPIMKKAKAIITDEGGIMCHAAIVARELNIPCIIGAKTATSILKDGNKVCVDAHKGLIKKL